MAKSHIWDFSCSAHCL